MEVIIAKDYETLSRQRNNHCRSDYWRPDSVLGLATGSTPVGTYKHLVALYGRNYRL